MTEPKWTPGPWVANGQFVDANEGYDQVCMVREIANAHLIAAAPDLYDALDELASELRDHSPDHPVMRQITAALAKARGETP